MKMADAQVTKPHHVSLGMIGTVCLIVAVFLDQVTVASERYFLVLSLAVVFAAVAATTFLIAITLKPRASLRTLCAIGILVAFLVIVDSLMREFMSESLWR